MRGRSWPAADHAGSPARRSLFLVLPWWRRILALTLGAVLATFLVTEFAMTRWYRAVAMIRPASQEGPTYGGGILGVTGLGSIASSLSSTLGVGSAAWDADEEMAILTSYDFTLNVVDKLNIADRIVSRHAQPWSSPLDRLKILVRRVEAALGFNPYTRWRLYKRMSDLFDAQYDDKLGNLEVSFLDPDPKMATRVLEFYLHTLRELLRKRAAGVARAAIDSMEDQAAHTSDSLLLAQLDQLIAAEMQQEATAEVQSDFAFVMIQPAYVPSVRDQPWVLVDCLVVAILSPAFFFLGVLFNERVIKPYRDARLAETIAALPEAKPQTDQASAYEDRTRRQF